MCATSDQSSLEGQQMDAYTQAQTLASQQYGSQTAINSGIQSILQPILAAGPSQKGYAPGEVNDLDSQAIEGTATNYKNAQQAVGEQEATEGGGTSPMSGGPQAQIKSEIASSAAGNLSNEETGIDEASYAQGRQNFGTALQGEDTIAQEDNPLGFESAATTSGNSADSEANAVASENNSWINATIGAVGSVAGGWAKGGFQTPGGGS